jgi:hypothetical protein
MLRYENVRPPLIPPLMRTLAVSLVGIAAVVVSLAIVRHRHDLVIPPADDVPEPAPPAVDFDLDKIRSAGW